MEERVERRGSIFLCVYLYANKNGLGCWLERERAVGCASFLSFVPSSEGTLLSLCLVTRSPYSIVQAEIDKVCSHFPLLTH